LVLFLFFKKKKKEKKISILLTLLLFKMLFSAHSAGPRFRANEESTTKFYHQSKLFIVTDDEDLKAQRDKKVSTIHSTLS